jgi:hypothetical protein
MPCPPQTSRFSHRRQSFDPRSRANPLPIEKLHLEKLPHRQNTAQIGNIPKCTRTSQPTVSTMLVFRCPQCRPSMRVPVIDHTMCAIVDRHRKTDGAQTRLAAAEGGITEIIMGDSSGDINIKIPWTDAIFRVQHVILVPSSISCGPPYPAHSGSPYLCVPPLFLGLFGSKSLVLCTSIFVFLRPIGLRSGSFAKRRC